MRNKKLVPVIIAALLVILYVLQLFGDKTTTHVDTFSNYSQLILTKHAKCRMDCRNINEREIKEIIGKGNLNRSKSGFNKQHGDSTYAFEGYSYEKQHIRVVVSPKENQLVVITVIDLDKKWQCDCN